MQVLLWTSLLYMEVCIKSTKAGTYIQWVWKLINNQIRVIYNIFYAKTIRFFRFNFYITDNK